MRRTPFLHRVARFSVARFTAPGSGTLADAYSRRLSRSATGIPVYDSQCGFKLIRRRCYEAVRSRLREKRFAFDVELLVALRQSGARVIEVPIDWCDVPGSKLHFLRDSAQMLTAVIGMRRRRDLGIRR